MSCCRRQRFPRARVSVRAARQFVGDTLGEWGISDRRDDIRLCASELATNAVLHGVPEGREFEVVLIRTPGVVSIAVRDSGPGLPQVRRAASADFHGRGLWLVSELADEFNVEAEPVGKTVRVCFKVGSGCVC
ncbi:MULTISPECIES: ATP-binding protein [unclassified Streptomyces]|uniref:ATP-binding protein n=1 Tax=unclassified Streptomyces TaxID=2593676 RepID=UPI001BE620AB|nr:MULTISPECIES: ATP-binding protein [unclassified Streptomyces]MBT2405667.1 ATP-binding protein [Streptomyces sp. ISL-21]MBT2459163.1 ATP-binding protein [Streptomyces sp. ISL-86]MBT2610012.1 ATP-binding protein [Streptomyces sp. ISL-87]